MVCCRMARIALVCVVVASCLSAYVSTSAASEGLRFQSVQIVGSHLVTVVANDSGQGAVAHVSGRMRVSGLIVPFSQWTYVAAHQTATVDFQFAGSDLTLLVVAIDGYAVGTPGPGDGGGDACVTSAGCESILAQSDPALPGTEGPDPIH